MTNALRSSLGWIVLIIVSLLATYFVHWLASGTECGWGWARVGGACRAIILISVLAGLIAGVLARACANAVLAKAGVRAAIFAALTIGVVVGATYVATGFQDYRRASRAITVPAE